MDFRLPLAIERHLALGTFLFEFVTLRLPDGTLARKFLRRDRRRVHGTLIVNLEVDVQNGVQILVVNRFLARLIVRLRLLAVDLRQPLLLTLKFDTRRDHRLRILLPDGILEWCFLRLRRIHRRQCGQIAQEQRKRSLLGAQCAKPCIGRMRRKHLCHTDRSDIAFLRRRLALGSEEKDG